MTASTPPPVDLPQPLSPAEYAALLALAQAHSDRLRAESLAQMSRPWRTPPEIERIMALDAEMERLQKGGVK